jgi:sec-independent protein translocase protein TatA
MGELSPWHWIIVLLIFAVLFGGKKLPDAARGIGRSLRIFKAEMQSARDDEAAESATAAAPTAPTDAATTAPAPVEDAVPVDAVIVPQPTIVTPDPVKPTVEA